MGGLAHAPCGSVRNASSPENQPPGPNLQPSDGCQSLILCATSCSASPTLRRALPKPSSTWPAAWSAWPSPRNSSSLVALPTPSLILPLSLSTLPLSSSLFIGRTSTAELFKRRDVS